MPPRHLPLSVLLCSLALPPAGADSLDHDRAKHLRDRGEIVALERILAAARRRIPGLRMLEVELSRHNDGRLVYELEFLNPAGEVLEHYYDARTGELVAYEVYRLDEQGRLIGLEYDARTGELLEREIEGHDDEDDD